MQQGSDEEVVLGRHTHRQETEKALQTYELSGTSSCGRGKIAFLS